MAPDQAFFLRENLKLRLLNARLALLARQFDTAQADLQRAQGAIDRYFDRSSRRTLIAADLVAPGRAAGAPVGVAAAGRHARRRSPPRRRAPLKHGVAADAPRRSGSSCCSPSRSWPRRRSAPTTAWSSFYWGALAARRVAQPVPARADRHLLPARRRDPGASTRWSACRGARANGASRGATAAARRRCATRWRSTSAAATRGRRSRRSGRSRSRPRRPSWRRTTSSPCSATCSPPAARTALQDRAARDEELRRALELVAPQPGGALGRGGRAPARRRMGARRPRCAARARAARRAAARRRAAHPRAAPEAAGGAARPAAAGGAEDGAAAGQAPGLLGGRRRTACCARSPSNRSTRRTTSTSCAGSGLSFDPADRRDPFVAARAAAQRRARSARRRGARLAAAVLGPLDRARRRRARRRRAGACRRCRRHRRRMAAAARGGRRRPCRATAPSRWPPAARWPSASCGARRGRCSSRRPATPRSPRRRAARPGSRSPSWPRRRATRHARARCYESAARQASDARARC